jgi:molybdopterin molybdotransferase
MIPLHEAQRIIRVSLRIAPTVGVPLEDALGCVAAEEIVARESVPGFANAAMDGYTLRASDTLAGSTQLRVTNSLMAGDVSTRRLESGEAVRIMTGTPLPDGADSVCKIEEVTVDPSGHTVRIGRTIRCGEHVRYPGEDISQGQVLITPGTQLGPLHLGVLASQGLTSVIVHPRPRVGVLSTGDGPTDSREPLPVANSRPVNQLMLLALLRQSGFVAMDLGSAPNDTVAVTTRVIQAVRECDAVLVTSGASAADVEFVTSIIGELSLGGATSLRAAVNPVQTFVFGNTGPQATPTYALTGDPLSILVGFELYVRPALRSLAQHRVTLRPLVSVVLDRPLARRRDGTLHLVPVLARFHEDGRLHAEQVARHHSLYTPTGGATNALAWVCDGDGLGLGEDVPAMIVDTIESAARSASVSFGAK